MTRYQFEVTLTGSAIRLSTAALAAGAPKAVMSGAAQVYSDAFLPFAKLEAYMKEGGAANGYVGGSDVASSGTNRAYVLEKAPSSSVPGGSVLIQSFQDANLGNLGDQYVNGTNTDVMVIVYHQA